MFVRSEDGLITDEAPARIERFDYYSAAKQWRIYGKNGFCIAEYATEQEALARMDDVNAWLDAPERRDVLHLKQICNAGTLETTEEPTILVVRKPAVYQFSKPIGFWKEGVK